jgi:Leucine-rich repeat (LRR) protein
VKKMSDILVIDESNFKEIKSLNGLTDVALNNSLRIEIDMEEIYRYLVTVDGTDKVESLHIGAFSCLKNVEIIKVFPNLRNLFVHGSKITSFDGLEMFRNGSYIDINTGKNTKRDISKISAAPIRSMELYYERLEDFDAVKNCLLLNHLVIAKSPGPDFYVWENVPLNYLGLISYGKFTELSDTASVKTLERLMVGGCQKFERFTGDNSKVKNLTVVTCKKFDVRSLCSLRNLEFLCVNNCAPEIALSELPALPKLRTLWLYTCRVNYDIFDLKKKFPKLEVFWPSRIKKEQAVSLSKANADVVVKYKQQNYVNGCHVPD